MNIKEFSMEYIKTINLLSDFFDCLENWNVEKYIKQCEATEENEMEFSIDVSMIISQLEIYDRVWFLRHMPKKGEHSQEAKELVRVIITRLEEIPDGCAECFPFETIDELKQEYLSD